MNQRSFNLITGILFAIIFLVHIVRSILGWEATVNGWAVPIGLSVVLFLVAGYLSYTAFSLGKTKEE